MDRLQTLYDDDFYAWTREQAAALDELRRRHWNGPLDLPNLAEEVADLGKAERNAVFSQAERLIEHLLKLTHSKQTRPRRGWIVTVDDARRELHKHLTLSLEAALDEGPARPLPPRAQAHGRQARALRRAGRSGGVAGKLPVHAGAAGR